MKNPKQNHKTPRHTPGPWKIERWASGELTITGLRPDDLSKPCGVARVFKALRPDVNEANARLLAASPDVYECLKRIVETILTDDRLMNAMKRDQARSILDAQALIARIEGTEE